MRALDTQNNEDASGSWVAIARLVRPRGRKGEVVAEVLTDFPSRFEALRRAFIEAPAGPPRQIDIAQSWWHDRSLILRFEGVTTIDQAAALKDRLLLIPAEDRVKLDEGSYYVSELIGCEVVRAERRIGRVTGLESNSGAGLLLVESEPKGGAKSREILIPFAQEICTGIDVAARRIVIEPPEGLLELGDE